jgi:hypothetical protein
MNRFFLLVLLFPLLFSLKRIQSLLIGSDNRESPILFKPKNTIDSLKQLVKPADLQKQEIYDQLYEEYRVYKSDSALVLLEKVCKSQLV